jgi:cytoskeletal protein CcmA (bactofilin family)
MATFFRPPRFLIRTRAAARPQSAAPIEVTCYRCAKSSKHSPFAESASCPHCAGRLCIGDVHIEDGHWGTSIQTTGSVTIGEHAQVQTNLIICSGDLHIAGKVHAMCATAGTTTIAQTAELLGGLRTSRLILEAGATIRNCLIQTKSDAIGNLDVEAAMRTAPGKGQSAQIEFKPIAAPLKRNPNIAARIYPTKDGPKQARFRDVS